MTTREIQHYLSATIGTEFPGDQLEQHQRDPARRLCAADAPAGPLFHPIPRCLDASVVKVKDNNAVRNKDAHIAVGVDTTGVKHVLRIWVQQSRRAKCWAQVRPELANRGVQDIIVTWVDALPGATWKGAWERFLLPWSSPRTCSRSSSPRSHLHHEGDRVLQLSTAVDH